jgi:aryl-alcohol dehydrogenase-like predicted oxidoreductase
MDFRHLGKSGLKVSEIIFGNWITHGSQVDDETAHATIHAALDAGITTFDTADVYAGTKAEAVMGAALKDQRREGIEILTKVYWPTGPGVNDRGLSRKHIMESCHASLKRLQTDYVDLYQAHRFDYETPLEETLRAFDDLVRQGKVLYVGVSEWKADQIREAVRIAEEMGFDRIVSNQPQYSMLYRVIEGEVIPASEENGIGQIVWSPMAQGVLTGKYQPGQPVPQDSRASGGEGAAMINHWLAEDVLAAVQRLKPIADDLGLTMGQLALAWVLANPDVSAAIIGASRPEQIHENVKASGVALTPDTMSAIDEALGDVVTTDPALTESPNPRP